MDLQRLVGEFHRSTEPAPGVLLLEFNRLPVNAFHDAMWTEMGQIVNRASADPGVRVIVLSSTTDRIFTGGLDLTDGGALFDSRYTDPARRAFALNEHILDFQGAISTLSNCRAPVIAALHGAALGLAIDIASACDIRLAAENVSFGIMEINVGLAADIGTLQRFPKIVGNDSIARELALTGRKFGAEEAKEIGFVSRVIKGGRAEVVGKPCRRRKREADELAAAIEMSKIIASKSPVAAVSTKHLMNHARDHSVREGLEYTAAWNMSMLQSSDTQQAMKAVLAKKSASFAPLGPDPKAKL